MQGLHWLAILLAGGLFAVPAASQSPDSPAISAEVLARFGEGPTSLSGSASAGYRSEIERSWFEGRDGLAARATRTRIRALELGAENLEAPAVALIALAKGADELGGAMLAARLAPDLPLARMAEARANWRAGEYRAAFVAGWQGVLSIPRHLEGSLWVAGTLLLIVAVVLIFGSMAFIAVVGSTELDCASHDLGDWVSPGMPTFARVALIAAAILLPLALGEGAMGLTLGLFAVGFAYAGSRMRMALGLAGALILIGAYPVMNLAGVALTAFEGDRVAVSIHATVQGFESPRDIAMLTAAAPDDPLAAHALAVHARRRGQNALAFERYTAILESRPRDAVVLTNLGNLHFGAGETEAAIDAYQRAVALTDSPTLMFNLSQAFARAFRMDEFETAMQKGQSFDAARVAQLSSIRSADFVVDLPIPASAIRTRLLSAANGDALAGHWLRRLAPGMLGNHYAAIGGTLALIALGAGALGGRFEHSSRCGRCGRRICTRCDGTVWSSELCEPCHHLFAGTENTDRTLREARIRQLRQRERRVRQYETLAALLIPGVGGVLAKRPDLGIVGVLLFAFAATSFVWHRGVVPDPLAVGAAGSLALLIGAVMASFAYLMVVLASLSIRRSS